MKKKFEMSDLLSLLKVFDANFVSDEDCMRLSGLNVNITGDVIRAAEMLLLPEFQSYPRKAQERLTDTLRMSIADENEDFSEIFERIELAFDEEPVDRRAFMAALLEFIDSRGKEPGVLTSF